MAFKMKGSPFHQMESDAQQRKDLMNDNPVDSKASALNKMDPMHNGKPGVQQEDFEQFSSPMNQGKADMGVYDKHAEEGVMASRESNIKHHRGVYDAFDQKAKGFKPSSQSQADGINSKYSNLAANVNTRIHRANKSADSIDSVRRNRKSANVQDFNKLMGKKSSPMNQGVKEENAVMKSRKKNIDSHQATYDAFDKKAKSFKPTSQAQVDAINSKYTDLAAKVNKRVSRANKSADSIDSVRKGRKSQSAQDFNKLMGKKSSPMNQGTKIADKIAAGKAKADAKKKKSPLNNKENRAEVKAAKEGKSGKEKRQAAREVRKQQRKEGKRGVKKTIKQVEKTVAKVKDSKIYKVGKGIADTVSNVKKGKIGAAIKSGKQTIADAKKKKSDSPATMKKHKY